MGKPLRVLVIEDSEDDTLLLMQELQRGGYEPVFERAATKEAMISAIANQTWDIIISDYILPHFSGLEALRVLQKSGRDLPFIVVSGKISEETAVETMKAGAHDYMSKNNLKRFVPAVKRELGEAKMRRERQQKDEELRAASLYARNLIEASLDPLVTISSDGKITDVNKTTEQVSGVSREQLVGSDFADYFTEPEKARAGYEQVFSQGIVKDYPLTIRHTSGRLTDVLYNASVYKNEAGEVQGVFAAARDITKLKQMERELAQAKEEEFKAIFDNAGEGILISDSESKKFYRGNNAICQMLGYNPEEIKNLGVMDIHPEKDIPYVVDQFERQLKREFSLSMDLPIKRKDGSVFYADVNATTIKIIGKIYLMGFFHDTTDRKNKEKLILDANRQLQETSQELFSAKQKLEREHQTLEKASKELEKQVEQRTEELTKANKTLQAVEENMHKMIIQNADGLIIVNKNGIVRFVNPAACSLFNRKPEEFIGEIFGFPVVAGQSTEIDVIHRNGKPVTAEMQVVETEWEGETVNLVSIRDITDHKLAMEKVKYAAQQWRTTFDSISDMVSIHDRNFKIIRVNKALADIFEIEPKELIGKTCYELFHGTRQPCQNCPHIQTLNLKKTANLEIFEQHLGVHLGIFTSPVFDKEGEVVSSVHIAKNITERKQAEKALKEANEKLIEYNQLKDEFVSTASHELRTPLSIIMGAIRLILDEIPGKIVDEQKDVLTIAMENVKRLARIVDSLLTISKIESGKVELHKTAVNICELIKDTISYYKLLAEEKKLSLDYEVPEEGIDICLDPDRTKEILINLISNSIKFTPAGGWIKVACNRLKEEVQFSVQDSGIGIAKEDMPKLFDKFTQFGRKAGPGEKGTGLGLAIAKKLIDMHNGRIEVESKVDQGTTFTISLPLTVSEKDDLPAEADELVENTLTNN